MKLKAKSLKETEIDSYIKEHGGRLTANEVLLGYANAPERKGYVHYYEFDNGSLLFVIQQLGGRRATLYENKDAYIKNMIKIRAWNTRTPLDKHQDLIRNLPEHTQSLINDLYAKLKLEHNVPVKDVDLEKLDKAIKKYGYEKAYEDLYLHLIVFGGEYVKDKFKGSWIIERSEQNELVPIFIDGRNKKYKFDFWIGKDFAKNGKFSMKVIILAEMNSPINVHPNPTLRNPNH